MGPLRTFYQGLIHAAVGLHHLRRGNRTGAFSQLTKAVEKLKQAPPEVHGLKVSEFVAQLTAVRDGTGGQEVRIRS